VSAASEIVLAPADTAEQAAAAQCAIRHARTAEEAVMLHEMLGLDGAVLPRPWADAVRILRLADSITWSVR
jgi:hypothetical protein